MGWRKGLCIALTRTECSNFCPSLWLDGVLSMAEQAEV
jgi:hypothetical protein